MAHVYGQSQAERNAIDNVDIEAEKLGDIEKKLSEHKDTFKNRKDVFFKKLPKMIEDRKEELVSEKINLENTKKEWNKKINLRNLP